MRLPYLLSTWNIFWQCPGLSKLLRQEGEFHNVLYGLSRRTLIGWGRKPSGLVAAALADRDDRKLLLIEDGFLRSFERSEAPEAVVLDRQGIYYDASAPSDLEDMIRDPLTASQQEMARQIMIAWRQNRVSKYNAQADYSGTLPAKYVLLIDQVRADASLRYGAADDQSFVRMLEAARDENPDCVLVVKLHPDALTLDRASCFDLAKLRSMPGLILLDAPCHPVSLLEAAEKVYTVTSQMGFESLIWGKPVRVFGMPFYAGWGLTDDALETPTRRQTVSLEQLIYAVLVRYCRYVNSAEVESAYAVLDQIASLGQRRLNAFQPSRK